MKKKLYPYCFFLFFILHSCAQNPVVPTDKPNKNNGLASISYTAADSLLYQSYINIYKQKKELPAHNLITETASFFLETPYVGSTLEKDDNEQLIINLREFDCTTFVESCLALVKTLKSTDRSFVNYCRILQNIRYRNGIIKDYSSRLHYMVDWAYENEHTTGLVQNISSELKGVISDKNINFMSTHPDSYTKLKENPVMQEKIKSIENAISQRKSYIFIPKENLASQQNKLQNGDIVLFATTINGLDYFHAGLVKTPVNAPPTFIHASSSSAMKVIIQTESLVDYVNKSKSCTGVTILRIL